MNQDIKNIGSLFSDAFKSVEADVIGKINKGYRIEEDHITTTVFDLLEERVKDRFWEGINVEMKQLPGRGKGSEESLTGADGSVILTIPLKNSVFQKFYIFQAKKDFDGRKVLDKDAIKQKEKMLLFASSCFFMIYDRRKISFISAQVVDLNNRFSTLPTKRFVAFHRDFFNCFIGQPISSIASLIMPLPMPAPPAPPISAPLFYMPTEINMDVYNQIAKKNLFITIKKNL